MLFNSLAFVAFFGVVLASYWSLRSWGSRKNLLLVASYAFYGAWNPPFVLLLPISTLVDFYAGKQLLGGRPHAKRIIGKSAHPKSTQRDHPAALSTLLRNNREKPALPHDGSRRHARQTSKLHSAGMAPVVLATPTSFLRRP